MYICRGCGNFMEENERVCPSCGTPRGEEPKPEPSPETEPLHGTVPRQADARRPVKRRQEEPPPRRRRPCTARMRARCRRPRRTASP